MLPELGAPLVDPPAGGPARGTGYYLLLSHTLTKLGSKGWEFATPLLLLTFSPQSLVAPTLFGLAIFLVKFAIGPPAGAYIDRTRRMTVVRAGIALQSLGVVGALLVLMLHSWLAAGSSDVQSPHLLLGGMMVCGCAEVLGATLSSVSIKKDWVPTAWAEGSEIELATINSWMASIDLGAEMVGPVVAGFTLSAAGGVMGFVIVGIANVISFGAELLLLQQVYDSNRTKLGATPPQLRNGSGSCYASAGPSSGNGSKVRGLRRCSACVALCRDINIFFSHPGGVPMLVVSYALCWFSVLTPHGIILTAYLQTRRLQPATLSIFRAAGAAAGGLGILAFQRAMLRYPIRRIALVQLLLFASCVVFATVCFRMDELHPSDDGGGASGVMLGFLVLIALSRLGLYGFDTALLQLQQLNVDEALRGTIGAMESSLCALGTLCTFASSLVSAEVGLQTFGVLVYLSTGFVCASALMYTLWCVLWHEHSHSHPDFDHDFGTDLAAGIGDSALETSHWHYHAHRPGLVGDRHPHTPHAHTTQQLRALRASASKQHTHLHFHPLGGGGGSLWRRLMALRAEI